MLKVANLYILQKKTVATWSFYVGILMAFFGSLNPWFMWSISNYYHLLVAVIMTFSLMISRTMRRGVYNNPYFLLPIFAFFLLYYYQTIVRDGNFNGYITGIFQVVVFYAILRVDDDLFSGVMEVISKVMGWLLLFSITAYLLFLFGFPLPSVNAEFTGTTYSYTNYFFFLLDDRILEFITFARFHSVFLEPAHLGSATVFLLMTQFGKWKRWYNIVMIVATLLTFSLTAYVMLVAVIFLSLWIQGKALIRKVLITLSFLAAITAGAFFYNGGDNLVHDLILIRMEIEDEELAGDNRVTDNFKAEYEQYIQTSDVFIGRGEYKDEDFGNSGFRVYIYQYGLIGLFLLVLFYALSYMHSKDWRAMVESAIIAILFFVVQAFSLWYCVFIPLYYMTKVKSVRNTSQIENIQEEGI